MVSVNPYHVVTMFPSSSLSLVNAVNLQCTCGHLLLNANQVMGQLWISAHRWTSTGQPILLIAQDGSQQVVL